MKIEKLRSAFKLFLCLQIALLFNAMQCKRLSMAKVEPDSSQAKIFFVKGKVTINDHDAKVGDPVENLSQIATDENSVCDILMGKKNIIHIEPQTKATLNIAKAIKEVELKKGSLAAVLKELNNTGKNNGEDSFRIRTITVTAGVRGTSFFVHTEGDKTYICDCNGTIDLFNPQKEKTETLESAHHTARVFSLEGSKVKVEEGTLEYHDDKLMEGLAKKINSTIDWSKAE